MNTSSTQNKKQQEHNRILITLLTSEDYKVIEHTISLLDPFEHQDVIIDYKYNITSRNTTRSRKIINMFKEQGFHI